MGDCETVGLGDLGTNKSNLVAQFPLNLEFGG
jgi:hypothetical protein